MEKKEFLDWLSTYTDAEACLEAFQNQKHFFRLNTLKMDAERFLAKSGLRCEQTGYYSCAFEQKEKIELGKTWEYFLGWIYPQSLSSIMVSLALAPTAEDVVLDAAAAPGSKFSHLAMLMENKSVLVGNDFKKERISALYATINRMNLLNCIVTLRDGAKLDWKERFTKVLVDAPCTALGSGMGAMNRWELNHSKSISTTQKKMLFSAYDALQPGGGLVYSTCTYAKEENEDVVASLLENVPEARLEAVDIGIPHEKGLDGLKECCRIYPQHLQSEGFFMAKIRKGE